MWIHLCGCVERQVAARAESQACSWCDLQKLQHLQDTLSRVLLEGNCPSETEICSCVHFVYLLHLSPAHSTSRPGTSCRVENPIQEVHK